jgi:hypothetical protein
VLKAPESRGIYAIMSKSSTSLRERPGFAGFSRPIGRREGHIQIPLAAVKPHTFRQITGTASDWTRRCRIETVAVDAEFGRDDSWQGQSISARNKTVLVIQSVKMALHDFHIVAVAHAFRDDIEGGTEQKGGFT